MKVLCQIQRSSSFSFLCLNIFNVCMLPAMQETLHARLNHAHCIYSLITIISEGSTFFFCKKSDSISLFPAMQEILHARLHHARLWLFPPLVLGQRQWQVLFNSFCLLPFFSLSCLLQFSNSNSSQLKVLFQRGTSTVQHDRGDR